MRLMGFANGLVVWGVLTSTNSASSSGFARSVEMSSVTSLRALRLPLDFRLDVLDLPSERATMAFERHSRKTA